MINLFLVALHILVSLVLILVVLLQTGKRADLAGAFGGGGSQTAFGARGAATFLSKATTCSAIIFMVTSVLLGIRFGSESETSVVQEPAAGSAPQSPASGPLEPATGVPQPVPIQPPAGAPVPGAAPSPAPAGQKPSPEKPPADPKQPVKK